MKISQVSKIFDIPAETPRFIEREGFVHPSRSGDGQYREYDIKAFGELFDYMTYRKLGLPLKDIEYYMKTGSLDFLADKMKQKEFQLAHEISRMGLLKTYIEAYRKKLDTLSCNLGVCWFEKKPKYRYITAGYNNSGIHEYRDVSALATEWRKEVPFVSLGYQIDQSQLRRDTWKTLWIFLLAEKYFQAFSLPSNEHVGEIPEQLCLCSFVKYSTPAQERDCCFPALAYLEEHGYRQRRAITAIRLQHTGSQEDHVQYAELMIPAVKL